MTNCIGRHEECIIMFAYPPSLEGRQLILHLPILTGYIISYSTTRLCILCPSRPHRELLIGSANRGIKQNVSGVEGVTREDAAPPVPCGATHKRHHSRTTLASRRSHSDQAGDWETGKRVSINRRGFASLRLVCCSVGCRVWFSRRSLSVLL